MRRVRLLVPAVAFILILAIVVGIGGRGVSAQAPAAAEPTATFNGAAERALDGDGRVRLTSTDVPAAQVRRVTVQSAAGDRGEATLP